MVIEFTRDDIAHRAGQCMARLRRVLRDDFALEHVTLQIEALPAAAVDDPACAPCDESPAVEPRRASNDPR